MNEFVVTFRECLEAALIVGIIYAVLDKNQLHNQKKMLWLSVGCSVVASVILGVLLYDVLKGAGEGLKELLEGIFMFVTAGLLYYVIFWMSKTLASRNVITQQTNSAVKEGGKWGLFLLVFFAILREGFETALFLVASTSVDTTFSYAGFFTGILLAVLLGYLIAVQGKKIKLRPFFKYTSLLLVFFAAGMVAYGTHEIHEYLEHREHGNEHAVSIETIDDEAKEEEEYVYDIFETKTDSENLSKIWYRADGSNYVHIMNDNGIIGSFFKGLFGYNSNPILIEVILWFASLLFGLFIWWRAYKV